MINFAHYAGVCISERHPCTPVPEFQREVRAALVELGYEGPITWCDTVHSLEWIGPRPDRDAARAAGAGFVTFGGLPPISMDEQKRG